MATSMSSPQFMGFRGFQTEPSVKQARYSFLFDRGKVTFFTPPARGRSIDATTLELASRIRNADIEWYVYPPELYAGGAPPPSLPASISPRMRLNSPTFEFELALKQAYPPGGLMVAAMSAR
jgi:hypothetical protein